MDQDLSARVAETINDDDVKQRLVPIVFHACVTRQRRRHESRAPMYMKRTNNPPLQTRVREEGSHTN